MCKVYDFSRVVCLLNKKVELSLIKCNYYRLVSLFGKWRRPYRLGGAIALCRAVLSLPRTRHPSAILGSLCPARTLTTNLRAALRYPDGRVASTERAMAPARRYISRRPRYMSKNNEKIIKNLK